MHKNLDSIYLVVIIHTKISPFVNFRAGVVFGDAIKEWFVHVSR